MGFSVEDSGLIITLLLYKAALVLTVLRWALSWAVRMWNRAHSASNVIDPPHPHHSPPAPSSNQIRESLTLTTYSDITYRVSGFCDTCAVCLSQLSVHGEIRELRNCRHVFHKECIDRWVDHDHDHDDNHKTCPLCRVPLLTDSQSLVLTTCNEPSWAIERILYLFGDDLLM